tara:strand:+ start:116 stop:541 length:426 start_codon:yes stop_codon:yes gene_type:complete
MENYLYVRTGGVTATEDDEVTGSTVYPVSAFRGMCSGTSTQLGAVTDDDNALSLFFTTKGRTGGVGDVDDAAGDNVDVVVLACAQYGQKKVMANLVAAMAAPFSGTFITLYDGYADKPSADPTTDIEGVTGSTVIHVESAD